MGSVLVSYDDESAAIEIGVELVPGAPERVDEPPCSNLFPRHLVCNKLRVHRSRRREEAVWKRQFGAAAVHDESHKAID
jgi:hypothetical protein